MSGTATFRNVEGGLEVIVNLQGLPEAGEEHITHIHGDATCADARAGSPGPIRIPLTTIVTDEDGAGSATTILDADTLEQLFDPSSEQSYIQLHARAEEPAAGAPFPSGIACADILSMAVVQTVPEKTGGLPRAGGPAAPSMCLPAGGLHGRVF